MGIVVVPMTERQALVLRRVSEVVAGHRATWLTQSEKMSLRAASEAVARALWGPCNCRTGRGPRVGKK